MSRPSPTEVQLRDLIANVGDAIFLVDKAGRIVTWNPAAERVFGYSPAEALQLMLADIYPRDTALGDSVPDTLAIAAVAGRAESSGWAVSHDGRRLWISVVICAIDTVTGGFALVARDETALRQAQEGVQERASELKRSNTDLEAFAALASHDLQEPLRKIRMFADRQQKRFRSEMPADATALTARIDEAAQRMQCLIDELLNYARTTRRARVTVPVDLGKTLELVRSDLEPRVEESRGRLEIGAMPTVEGDSAQLQQLFQNLIGNALKFARPGQAPMVRVASTRTAPDRWSIRVEDNGIGFDPRHADRIFGMLQRLHGRHEYEGTGMGLAICRRIAECHDGTIVAENIPGRGAAFTVELPERQRAGKE